MPKIFFWIKIGSVMFFQLFRRGNPEAKLIYLPGIKSAEKDFVQLPKTWVPGQYVGINWQCKSVYLVKILPFNDYYSPGQGAHYPIEKIKSTKEIKLIFYSWKKPIYITLNPSEFLLFSRTNIQLAKHSIKKKKLHIGSIKLSSAGVPIPDFPSIQLNISDKSLRSKLQKEKEGFEKWYYQNEISSKQL